MYHVGKHSMFSVKRVGETIRREHAKKKDRHMTQAFTRLTSITLLLLSEGSSHDSSSWESTTETPDYDIQTFK
jgi:hypothetical protein